MQLRAESIRFAPIKGERKLIYYTWLPDAAGLNLQSADNC